MTSAVLNFGEIEITSESDGDDCSIADTQLEESSQTLSHTLIVLANTVLNAVPDAVQVKIYVHYAVEENIDVHYAIKVNIDVHYKCY